MARPTARSLAGPRRPLPRGRPFSAGRRAPVAALRERQAIRDELVSQAVAHAGVFGSVARGTETSVSDLDIFVVFAPGWSGDALDQIPITERIEARLRAVWPDMPIDVVDLDAVSPVRRAEVRADAAGLDQDTSVAGPLVVDGVERCLERIADAARTLGARDDDVSPDVKLPELRKLGSKLRHDSDRIRPVVLWRTVENRLEPLEDMAHRERARLSDADR